MIAPPPSPPPPRDCFVTHGVAGLVGTAMTGLFATNVFVNNQNQVGSFFGNPVQLAKQCAGISTTILLTATATVCIYGVLFAMSVPFGFTVWHDDETSAAPKKEVLTSAAAAPAIAATA